MYRPPRRWWIVATGAALLVWLACGFYFVRPDERGVVRWLGRVHEAGRRIGPGVHYALPWPFTRVDRPRTTEVRRLYVGLAPAQREAIVRGDVQAISSSPASDMLTGDVNILKITLVVQYQVNDPAAYLFGAQGPDRLVAGTVQSVLVEQLAQLPVDQALTAAKAALELVIAQHAQQRIDRYGLGIRLLATSLESLEPPRAVLAAFQDVASAKKDGERAVDRAVAEASRTLARARGDAARLIATAESDAQARVSRARGDTARFLAVLGEYRLDPELFRQRRLLETLELLLPRWRTYVVDDPPGRPTTRLRLLEPPRSAPAAEAAP